MMRAREQTIESMVFQYGLKLIERGMNETNAERGEPPSRWADIDECRASRNWLPVLFDDNTMIMSEFCEWMEHLLDDATMRSQLREGATQLLASKGSSEPVTDNEVVAAIRTEQKRAEQACRAHSDGPAGRRWVANALDKPGPAPTQSPALNWESPTSGVRLAFGVSAAESVAWLDGQGASGRACETARWDDPMAPVQHDVAATALNAAFDMVHAFAKAHDLPPPSCHAMVLSPPGMDRARQWPTTTIWPIYWPSNGERQVWAEAILAGAFVPYGLMMGLSSLTLRHTFPEEDADEAESRQPVRWSDVKAWAQRAAGFTEGDRVRADAIPKAGERSWKGRH